MGRNAGYAAAINAAAATVHPDADLLILNPDVRLRPGAAKLLVDRLTDPSVGVAVPRLLDEDGVTQCSLRREPSLMTAWTDTILGGTFAGRLGTGETVSDPVIYESGGLVEWATGAVLAVAARARGVVGYWDNHFFYTWKRSNTCEGSASADILWSTFRTQKQFTGEGNIAKTFFWRHCCPPTKSAITGAIMDRCRPFCSD